VGLRELAIDRVRGELLEQREELIQDATLVALHALANGSPRSAERP
jgi:hypothetical protein